MWRHTRNWIECVLAWLQNCLVRWEGSVCSAIVGDFGLAEKIPDYRWVPNCPFTQLLSAVWWLDKSLSSLCFFPTFYLFCLIPGIVCPTSAIFFCKFFISQHCIIWQCWGQHGSSKPQIPFMANDIRIVGCHRPSARCVSSSAGSNLQWHLSGTFF